MRFNVAGLLKASTGARRLVEIDEEFRVAGPDLEIVSPVVGVLELIRDPGGVVVSGQLETRLRLACSRCLAPAEVTVVLPIEEHYRPTVMIPGGAPIDPDPREDDDPATTIDARHTLDLSEVVRQAVLLSAPLNVLCKPDCRGLCANCGADLNQVQCDCVPAGDPRWNDLRALLDQSRS